MKNTLSIFGVMAWALVILTGCFNNKPKISEPEFDFSTKEGVTDFVISKRWAQWQGALTFQKNGMCNFIKKDLRTDQIEYNINGNYKIGNSKFTDNGNNYWYVQITWDQPRVISDFYTIYQTHLVEHSREWLSFDSYGPILESWRSEGGLVLNRNKIYPY
jgi:hypothetical protein